MQTEKTGRKHKNELKGVRGRTHQYSSPWLRERDKSFCGLCDYSTMWQHPDSYLKINAVSIIAYYCGHVAVH